MRVITLLLVATLLLLTPGFSAAQSELEDQLREKQSEIENLEKTILSLQSQAKTLSVQIDFSNSQIKITQLKIAQTEEEINLLISKIDRLETSIDKLSNLLENRISVTYRQSKLDPLSFLFSSRNLNTFILRYKYIKVVQLHDRKLLEQVALTQSSYQGQKQQEEQLKTKLESQKKLLNQQIREKESLLVVTQNDEKRYQKLLAAARAEQESIRAAMQSSKLKDGSPIKKGDTIALIGNTGAPGCSSGDHLHFEVTRNDQNQNPAIYLRPTSVNWDNQPDASFPFTGNWDFPINNPRITQGYGMTYWARSGWYGGSPHTGIDMVSDDIAIRAPESGTLYKGSANCKGAAMKYVAIDHGDGIYSWYWHVR